LNVVVNIDLTDWLTGLYCLSGVCCISWRRGNATN